MALLAKYFLFVPNPNERSVQLAAAASRNAIVREEIDAKYTQLAIELLRKIILVWTRTHPPTGYYIVSQAS